MTDAINAVKSGMKYGTAEEKLKISRSLLCRDVYGIGKQGRKTALSEAEEKAIVSLLLSFARQEIPLTLTHLRDAILMMLTSFDSGRGLTLQCCGFTASL